MKKPDRVEAGQWWLTGDIPYRVVSVEVSPSGFTDMGGPIVASSDGVFVNAHTMWTSAVLAAYEYLGSGENPEPSEWMIETLARHSFEVVNAYCRSGDHASLCDDPEEWDVAPETERQKARDVAALILAGKDPRLPYEDRGMHEGSILSLYRILRSLGKW